MAVNRERQVWGIENPGGCANLKMSLWFRLWMVFGGVWCFGRLLYKLLVLCVLLLLHAECLPPFIMAFFSAGGSSYYFVRTKTISIDRPFLLFLIHIFSSFSWQKLLSTILLLIFMFPPYCLPDFGLLFQAPFIYNIIIISWEGEDINEVY
jgi:hypothetical protein